MVDRANLNNIRARTSLPQKRTTSRPKGEAVLGAKRKDERRRVFLSNARFARAVWGPLPKAALRTLKDLTERYALSITLRDLQFSGLDQPDGTAYLCPFFRPTCTSSSPSDFTSLCWCELLSACLAPNSPEANSVRVFLLPGHWPAQTLSRAQTQNQETLDRAKRLAYAKRLAHITGGGLS